MIDSKKLIREALIFSLSKFIREAWKIIEPTRPLLWNWHHEYLCEMLTGIFRDVNARKKRIYDTIINVPPGTTKSTIITIMFPVWCWLNNPGMKFITASYAADLAILHAVKSRDIIQSEWFQDYFGGIFQLKYDVNKKSEYANDRGGSRIAVGVGGGATGKHGDIVICDDPINPKKAASQVTVADVNTWWDNTMSNRLTDPSVSQKIIVMQRLATNDLTGHCLKKKEEYYRHICLPAEISKYVIPTKLSERYVDGLLDPVRFDRDVLKMFRVLLGSNEYSGQYGQNPIAEEGNLFHPEWFMYFNLKELQDKAYDNHDELIWNIWVDGAFTEDTVNDPSGLLCAAKYNNNLYIRDVSRVYMELPELIKHIPDFAERNGTNGQSTVYIEPKASGMSAAQMLRRYTPLNVVLGKPPKDGKVPRAKAVLPFTEGGRCYLLRGAGWVDMFIDELKAFPFGEHDDIVDCYTMAADYTEINQGEGILDMASIG